MLELISSAGTGSDGEVKRSEPVKRSTQLYREKVNYSKRFKTVHAVSISHAFGKMNPAPIQRFDVRCLVFLIQASKPRCGTSHH